MKTRLRKLFGKTVVLPFVLATRVLSYFVGHQRAIEQIGPTATKLAKLALRLWVPKMNGPEDFATFPDRMKKKLWIWRPFYDIEISEENTDIFKLKVSNCPFCEALSSFGLSDLSVYVCEGDWAIAKENSGNWLFERSHQIGTGDTFCNHTYKRKQPA